jgi:hypothetical protein
LIDIAYIVSHGFAARMVTQTNLLGLLVKEGKKVALICPDKNDENLKNTVKKKALNCMNLIQDRNFGQINMQKCANIFSRI